MSRESEFESLENPALHYVAWASNEKSFRSYDKIKKEKFVKALPVSLIILTEGAAVKGWDDNAGEAIYSNIVMHSGKQELRVRCGKSLIAQGLYDEIKDKVKSLVSRFYK